MCKLKQRKNKKRSRTTTTKSQKKKYHEKCSIEIQEKGPERKPTASHIGDTRNIPRREVLVECCGNRSQGAKHCKTEEKRKKDHKMCKLKQRKNNKKKDRNQRMRIAASTFKKRDQNRRYTNIRGVQKKGKIRKLTLAHVGDTRNVPRRDVLVE